MDQAVPTAVTGNKAGPPDEFPIGWFQVAWTAEVPDEGVLALRYFDQNLVLFRTASSQVKVLDAHCLHLGAHLGYGGFVEGESIRCPFHGWAWNGEGSNTDVPYGEGATVRARLRSWPVREVGNFIYVWYHPSGEPPEWEPPIIEEEASGRCYPVWPNAVGIEEVNFYPQLLVENQADGAHISYVHRWPKIEFVENGPLPGLPHTFHTVLDGVMNTPSGPTPEHIDVTSYGMGIILGRMSGLVDTANVGCVTPIDATRSHARLTVFVDRGPEDTGDELSKVAKGIVRAQIREILGPNGDRGVFDHLVPPKTAMLRPSERPLRELRDWAQHFYTSNRAIDLS